MMWSEDPMAETAGSPRCAYRKLDNGINEFVFHESSKAAIDDFFYTLEKLLRTTPSHVTLRYLVDIAQGDRAVSIVTLTQRFRRLETQIPQRARGRTAILHKPGALITLFDNLIRTLAPSRDVTRFFPMERRDEAIRWLLAE
jgi:hypothetical protein